MTCMTSRDWSGELRTRVVEAVIGYTYFDRLRCDIPPSPARQSVSFRVYAAKARSGRGTAGSNSRLFSAAFSNRCGSRGPLSWQASELPRPILARPPFCPGSQGHRPLEPPVAPTHERRFPNSRFVRKPGEPIRVSPASHARSGRRRGSTGYFLWVFLSRKTGLTRPYVSPLGNPFFAAGIVVASSRYLNSPRTGSVATFSRSCDMLLRH